MEKLLQRLSADFPSIRFKPGTVFSWSPKHKIVSYIEHPKNELAACWSLIHEVSHAALGHTNYEYDIELVRLEAEAWKRASTLAATYQHTIDSDHIQNCLDTYRDWLHKRSTCPKCHTHSFQKDSHTYRCFNCSASWHVASSNLCRPYRRLVPTI